MSKRKKLLKLWERHYAVGLMQLEEERDAYRQIAGSAALAELVARAKAAEAVVEAARKLPLTTRRLEAALAAYDASTSNAALDEVVRVSEEMGLYDKEEGEARPGEVDI